MFQGPPRPLISPSDILELRNAIGSDKNDSGKILIKPKAIMATRKMATTGQVGADERVVASIAQQKAASHFNEMTHAFRSQTQRFAEQVISDVKSSKPQEQVEDDQSPKLEMPTEKEPTDKEPHAYHEESRVSEFGTLRIFFFK